MEEQQNDTNIEPTNTEAENAAVDNSQSETAVESGGEDGGAYTPDDAVLERAVKAGMTLADAKSFGSKEMAERFIGMLEGKGGKSGDNSKSAVDGDEFPAVDFGEFSEENGFHPSIVKAMTSLKNVIEAQAKVIKTLKAGKSAEKTQKAVETRKNLILSRPGGERGRSSSASGDAEAQAIASLRSRFKLN